MQRVFVAAVGAAVLVACSSDTSDSKAETCADISGNYSVKSSRVSGSCDPKLDGDGTSTISFAKAADGTWNVVIPAIEGGCPGTLDTTSCKFIANCKATAKDTGATLITYSLDYTFSARSFSGSAAVSASPPAVPTLCTITYSETGNHL